MTENVKLALIHRNAWKVDSPKFALAQFTHTAAAFSFARRTGRAVDSMLAQSIPGGGI
jgi:hypothetical protein